MSAERPDRLSLVLLAFALVALIVAVGWFLTQENDDCEPGGVYVPGQGCRSK